MFVFGFSAFRQNRLGSRLLLGVLIISGFLAFIITGIQLAFEYGKDINKVEQRLLDVRRSAGNSLAAAAWQYDQVLLELQLNGMLQLPDIVYAELDAEGMGHFELGARPQPGMIMDYQFPLIHETATEQQVIGSVTVVATRENALARLWDRLGLELLSQFAKTLIVSILLLFFFHYVVTRRLHELSDKAHNLKLSYLEEPIFLQPPKFFRHRVDELDGLANKLDLIRRSLALEVADRHRAEQDLKESQERFSLAMEGANDGLWDWDLESDRVYFSERWCGMLGYRREEVPPSPRFWLQHVDSRDREKVSEDMDRYLKQESDAFSVQYRIRHKDGHLVWVLSRGFAVRDDSGVPRRVVGTAVDITDNILAQSTIRKLSLAMTSSPVAVAICDDQYRLEYYNPLFVASVNLKNEKSDISLLDLLIDANSQRQLSNPLREALLSRRPWQGELQIHNSEGLLRWQSVKVSFAKGDEDGDAGFLILLEDITERKNYEQQLAHQANYDGLTSLPNRILAANRLHKALAKARRDETCVGIIFFDLDQFKLINDSLGHDVGDELLVQAAERLRMSVREDETIARFGGDEFLMILPDLKDPLDCETVATRIMSALQEPFQLNGRNVFITASLGISVYPQDGDTAEVLIQHADTAMYQSKNSGRSTFHFFTKRLNQIAQKQLEIETELRFAIERNELQVYLQPLYDCGKGEVVGAEALMRWTNEKLGQVAPGQFIEIAEKSALIHDLDDWMLDACCQKIRHLRDTINFDRYVSINVSSKVLQRESLPDKISRKLKEYDLPTSAIRLELTERSIINARTSTLAQLNALDLMGVHLSIDDFGTGYSAMSYLLNLPFKTVKIDSSFTRCLPDNRRHAALAKSIIQMIHNLDMTAVAEGIESQLQLEFLMESGCDCIQGYLIARPMPVPEFEVYINEANKGAVAG